MQQLDTASLLRELTCYLASHRLDTTTCHVTEVTFLPVHQPELVLDLVTFERC